MTEGAVRTRRRDAHRAVMASLDADDRRAATATADAVLAAVDELAPLNPTPDPTRKYSKRQFDPFCRRDRIHFYYTPTHKVETTVGQLNFFRWAIENHVVEYVAAHLQDIESAMRVYVKAQRDARRIKLHRDRVVRQAAAGALKRGHAQRRELLLRRAAPPARQHGAAAQHAEQAATQAVLAQRERECERESERNTGAKV